MNSRVTQSMMSRNVLADIEHASSRLDRTRQKLASGKELMRPSDDPFRASRALDYRSELAANLQHQRVDRGRERLADGDRHGARLDR